MPDYNSFQENFAQFILSASGFRKIFAADGDEQSIETGISVEDSIASAIIAAEFGALLTDADGAGKTPDRGKTVAVGTDARPTGPAVAAVMISALKQKGFTVRYSGITAAPELMAWVKTSPDIDGFAYISASHNPIGHNGFKFGFSDGAVLGGGTAKRFISNVISAAVDEDKYASALKIVEGLRAGAKTPVLPDHAKNKAAAEVAYQNFSDVVITAADGATAQKSVIDRLRDAASGIGIVAELNGSARGISIDKEYFESFGMKTLFLNERPGQVVHRIVPEGASLDLCRSELERAHAADPAFSIGYVPDNDGDRGNIVYINDRSGRAEILEAQEVFALSVKAELEFMKQTAPDAMLAVAVNGPTSMRIEHIAAEYGAEVFRSEVGEANVVNLAAEKRTAGYTVRILGEGSNGGNITHPATVRDPLNTIFALVKLLVYGGFRSLTEAVESLPAFTTTSAYEPEAKMQIGPISHAELKTNYEKIFPASFEKRKKQLEIDYGITGWYEVNYEGTKARKGVGAEYRSGKQTGGLKIMLVGRGKDAGGVAVLRDIAFLWMRGSGTEPVFRVMTDIKGDNKDGMLELLEWQRELVAEAAELDG